MQVDRVIVGGDVVPGPMPRETIEVLLGLDVPVQFIRGNTDREVLARIRGSETERGARNVSRGDSLVGEEIRADYEALLDSSSATLRLRWVVRISTRSADL